MLFGCEEGSDSYNDNSCAYEASEYAAKEEKGVLAIVASHLVRVEVLVHVDTSEAVGAHGPPGSTQGCGVERIFPC